MKKKMNEKNEGFLNELNELSPAPFKINFGRKKGVDPITVEASIWAHTIPLKIRAKPEDWKELEQYYINNPDELALDIYTQFIQHVVRGLRQKKQRGKHKGTYYFIDEVRYKIACLYSYLSIYPAYIQMIKVDKDYDDIVDKNKPIELTAYCFVCGVKPT